MSRRAPIPGLHHVTAIASDPQSTLDFYTGVLGLRLVKKTVNFDDPGTYHLYFGDEAGRPGTILTFFPWPGARRGRRGSGQTTLTSFLVPEGSLAFWSERLRDLGLDHETPRPRGEGESITLPDPDGLQLELVATAGAARLPARSRGGVPSEAAVRGFRGVTLTEVDVDATARFLTEIMGFEAAGEERGRLLFTLPGEELGNRIEVSGSSERGQVAAGTVHHIAFRIAGDPEEGAWREYLVGQGQQVSPVMDRHYFHSIYFREPGGVLLEIATDPPGFTADETVEELGSALRLPPFLESRRTEIESALPVLQGAARRAS